MAQRNNIQDFMSDVRSQTGVNGSASIYTAQLNSDNISVQISKGTAVVPPAVLYSKVYWNMQGSAAQTDKGSLNEDTVTIVDGSGFPRIGSAQGLINSLT